MIKPSVLALWLVGCGWGQVNEILEDVRKGATFRFKIHSSLPEYVFHLVGDPENNLIDKIEISRAVDREPIQVIEDTGMGEPPYRGREYFGAEDINFDGYADIRLLSSWGATAGGMAGMIHQEATYRFDGGQLVMVRSVEQNWVDEKKHFLKVTRERRNGTIQVVREEVVNESPRGR